MNIEFIGEKIVPTDKDENIIQVSLKSGIPHFHVCGGNAKCSTCRILIADGSQVLRVA